MTTNQPESQLPQRKAVTDFDVSLQRLYQGLQTSSISSMVAEQTPTIGKIKNAASETDARALLSLAICEVCDFFNVSKNMTDIQVAMTADLIIEAFWYLKLVEIKYCFRRAMRREKLYDRLDGSIILGWLAAYDSERIETAIQLSETEDTSQLRLPQPEEHTMSLGEYIDKTRAAALQGDTAAQAALVEAEKVQEMMKSTACTKSQREKDKDFKRWYYTEYIKNGGSK